MKEEYIFPFIVSAQSVLNTVCGIEVKPNSAYVRNSPFFVNQIIVMIGVIGEIKGQVIIELSMDLTKKIVSTMMGGMPVVELDEMSKSAISELGNMIMGATGTIFAKENINIDITPPSLLMAEKIEISNKVPTIVVPLELKGMGTLKINVAAEELI